MPESFRVLVCGSRDFSDSDHLAHILDRVLAKHPALVVVEGCANGADRMAEQWAQRNGIHVEHFPALWNAHGRRAGYVRNMAMAASKPDGVIAFFRDPADPSRGTAMMCRIAREAGIPVYVPLLPDYQF